jgi:hypothetical protein
MRKYIVLLASIIIASNLYADTMGGIRSSIRYKIQDSTATSNNPIFTDVELNKRINTVQRDIAKFTLCMYDNQYSTPITGVREYARPSNCITIDRVSFLQTSSTTSYKKLELKTMGGMDRDLIGWESYTPGRPLYYYKRGNVIGFDRPIASTYCYANAIKIDYYKYPADMTSDSDTPFDNTDYLQTYSDIIVLGVSARCLQDKMRTTESTAIQTEYIGLINAMQDIMNYNPDGAVQHIKVGN